MTFFGELIGGIVEGFLDAIGKSKPTTIPDIEYQSEYVIKYKKSAIFTKCIASILIIVLSSVCFVFTHNDTDTNPIFIVFAILGIITLLPAIYANNYKCKVTEEKLVFKKKCYYWNEITCVRDIVINNQHSHTVAVYDKNGKCVFDCDSDMENSWCLLKTAEKKSIEIRYEKDLTLRQISHL